MRRGVRAVGERSHRETPQEAWLSTSGGGSDRVGRPGLGEADTGGRRVRAGGRVRAGVLDGLELQPEVLVPRGGCRHERDPADVLPGREGRVNRRRCRTDAFDDFVKKRFPGRPARVHGEQARKHGEKERISTMTLEAVLNRAGQMNRAERWTCGPHVDSTNLIRFREPSAPGPRVRLIRHLQVIAHPH